MKLQLILTVAVVFSTISSLIDCNPYAFYDHGYSGGGGHGGGLIKVILGGGGGGGSGSYGYGGGGYGYGGSHYSPWWDGGGWGHGGGGGWGGWGGWGNGGYGKPYKSSYIAVNNKYLDDDCKYLIIDDI